MLKEAYITSEIAKILGIAHQNVSKRATQEGWKKVARPGRGGGFAYPVNGMSETTRAAIALALAREAQNLPAPVMSNVAVKANDIVIPDWSWTKAKARVRVVREWEKQIAEGKSKGIPVEDTTESFLACLRAGMLLPPAVIEAAGGLSRPRLYVWRKAIVDANGEVEAVADKRGGWLSGKPKGLGKIGEDAEQAFLGVYLKPNQPTVKVAYRAMEIVLQRKGLHVPSYTSVKRFIERFDTMHHDLVVWMREGEKAYVDKIGPFLSREDSILEVGDVLVADGHKLNFEVINPETGKPCRMTLIGYQDWASRMFVGFEIMLNENTQAISVSLFRSIINLGKLPRAVYIDNGKAFKNAYFDGDADFDDFDGLYGRLGIYVQHSMPYCARTKVIERWWGDFDRQCEVGLVSYTGASIAGKPAHLNRNEAWHKKQHDKEVSKIPTLEDAIKIVTEYARWKAYQPHPTRPNTTPYEVFMAGRGEGFPVAEAESLTRQFLHRRAIHPKRCRFTMMGVEFESDVLHGINKELTAHYSYSDLSAVYVYDEGRLLCTARPVATVNPLASLFGNELDMAKVKEGQKITANLRRDTRKQASALAAWGGGTETLAALPWMQPASQRKQPLTLRENGKRALPAREIPAISAEETAKLEAIAAMPRTRQLSSAAYTPPAFFSSRIERYEFLFNVLHDQGLVLTDADTAFMADFEGSQEYDPARKRYESLLNFYAKRKAAI